MSWEESVHLAHVHLKEHPKTAHLRVEARV